jgi:hypothetical protein
MSRREITPEKQTAGRAGQKVASKPRASSDFGLPFAEDRCIDRR